MKTLIAALAAAMTVTACGSSDRNINLAYEYAKSDNVRVCEWIYNKGMTEGVVFVVDVLDIRFREFTLEEIEAGVRKAAAEC